MNETIRQGTSRERRARETRSALLEAAEEAFLARGYNGAALDAIAARAGFTRGALYAHFTGKDDLFLAVGEQRREAVSAELDAVAAAALPDRPALLGAWLARSVREQRDWILAGIEFAAATARDPQLAARRREPVGASARMLAELVGHGPDAATVGEEVLALVNGLALRAAVDQEIAVEPILTAAVARIVGERS